MLKYPKGLHELHNDLPLLPERMKVSKARYNLHRKEKSVTHKNPETGNETWIETKIIQSIRVQ